MTKHIHYTVTSEWRRQQASDKLVKTQFDNPDLEVYTKDDFDDFFVCSSSALTNKLGWDPVDSILTCGLTNDNKTLWVYQTTVGYQFFFDSLPKHLLLEVLACAD